MGKTKFFLFWSACKEEVMPNSAVHERRHSEILHGSVAHSIPNLMKQATAILQRRVDAGELESLPDIPCEEFIQLQFVPNDAFRSAASFFTGVLQLICGVQMRTL